MQAQLFSQYRQVVAIGGGHGLGRVLSALAFLGNHLTGIVATTDNGGSTGRLRNSNDCIAWGDLRNCLSQLAHKPSVGSLLFEYRFDGQDELSGHNLGNLILTALDQLCVRPLEAINLIRGLLKIETRLYPMSEQPTHLLALDVSGSKVFGELEVDSMAERPVAMNLEPMVRATEEAVAALTAAELIILSPGSFLTSLMPPLLLPELAAAIKNSAAKVVFIDNLKPEASVAGELSLNAKLDWCQQLIGTGRIDVVLCNGQPAQEGLIYRSPLADPIQSGCHDRDALVSALVQALQPKKLIA
ncbi:TPA: uridine diphosphate-N-acetylglucosamine-binding protein YvcK [Shewanella algae]|uniref:uridine diphosphate-N-acetylglucosamine-binding protein YvcK n=1 Tax=Shewanella algae TaxID=38313 RepID=UPI001C5749DE|nr:uridine diphosphate-N-acetylglucosamine-binding protein YvcK [Shewanella algae]HDS1203942.1 uridine diphosphate-N-acetylglucosamine-binding protein YvcK [Shewanella algae]